MVQDKCDMEIPESVMIYLNEISERMKQGRAVVMVGSGFSKNADKCRKTDKTFLDWGQLGDIFYKKLYGKLPKDEENPYFYQDILKLADRVEQCFGRTVLDKLLLDNLPDEEYKPSKLHEMLLTLNWTDIFTTNYDTLLERTRERVFHKRYQLVLNKDDLVYSKCPRIIKLHGSFPSTRPFVVTEEDYRRYPKESAIFVNTVQQSLIENVMCMIGFSGEDPNFLNWIGWIRDNLGESTASKIYLVGVFDIRETERKLFQSRNIVIVNMKDCPGINSGDHKKGIQLFFKKLLELQTEEEKKVWESVNSKSVVKLIETVNNRSLKSFRYDQIEKIMKDIVSDWQIERKAYPGWIVAPYDRRERMITSVNYGGVLVEYLSDIVKLISYETLSQFLYEFDWRRKICLISLTEEWAEVYKKFIDIQFESDKHLSKEDYCLGLEILRFEHEIGDFKQWEKYEKFLSQEPQMEFFKQNLDLEKAYREFYSLEFGTLSRTLLKLQEFDAMSEEAFAYATLLTEMGYVDKTIRYLKNNLNDVRMQIGEDIDYHSYSTETYYMTLLEYLEKYQSYLTAYQGQEDSDRNQDYSHFRMLWGYECNPQFENDYLMQSLISVDNEKCSLIPDVDPQKYFNFLDHIGMTFRSSYLVKHVEKLPVLVRGMIAVNPYRAFISTIRFADLPASRMIWNQQTCKKIKTEQAENIARYCMLSCIQNREYILQAIAEKQSSNLAIFLTEIVPIILSGIVHRVKVKTKKEILSFLVFAIKEESMNFSNLCQLLREIISSLRSEELNELWQEIWEFPLGKRVQDNENGLLIEPIIYMDIRQKMDLNKSILKQIQTNATILLNNPTCNPDEKFAINLRLLGFGLMNKDDSMIERAAKEMDLFFKSKEGSVRKCFSCYLIYSGIKERIIEAKADYLERLFKQIQSFEIQENNCCLAFYPALDDQLKELKYYYFDKKETFPIWSNKEVLLVVQSALDWSQKLQTCYKNNINMEYCFSYWLLLEEIIVISFIHKEAGGTPLELVKEVQALGERIRALSFPFKGEVVIKKGMIVDDEMCNMFLTQLMKGGREYQEAVMLIRILKEDADRQDNIDLLWKLINQNY